MPSSYATTSMLLALALSSFCYSNEKLQWLLYTEFNSTVGMDVSPAIDIRYLINACLGVGFMVETQFTVPFPNRSSKFHTWQLNTFGGNLMLLTFHLSPNPKDNQTHPEDTIVPGPPFFSINKCFWMM